jgi:Flp pilus assembly protein TadD
MTKNLFKSLIIIFFFISCSALAEITYREILDNPTDLELNLNYAKQQEKAGNIKSTIATLERLSKLYPKNSDIKLYLISLLLKMDSKLKN